MPTPAPRFPVHPAPRWERLATVLLLLGFVVIGVNNILNEAFIGQDYSFHVGCTNRLLGRPDAWFAQDVTNRPLIYWIAIDGIHLTNNRAPFEFAAAVFLALNTAALWLVHDASRRFIAAPALRLAALALIAFWPATLITSVVFAADSVAMPPFALLCWSLLRWLEAHTTRASASFAALAGAALALGNFAKFTFLLLPAGVLVVAVLAWRWQHASPRRTLTLLALAVLAPSLVGLTLHRLATRELADTPQQHRFTWSGTDEMSWRSLLTVKPSDRRIFDAPGYWDSVVTDGRTVLPLLENNSYSYPALLHLGIFTDVLNFAQGGSQRSGRPRPQPQQSLAQASVRTGVLFSLAGVVAVALVTLRTLRAAVTARTPPRFGPVIWLVLGLTWFLPLVATLPFVHHAYDWGYWLPRLVIPALWGFGYCLYTWLDDVAQNRRFIIHTVTCLTAVQVTLQIASVWYP
jgi:hypothetical protein